MKVLLRLPVVRTLHQRQLLFPVIVMIIVAAVLFEGTLERSRPAQAVQESSFDEPVPRPVIRSDLEKTPLTYFSDYWNQLAEEARPNLTSIGSSSTPAILVGPGLALTTIEPALEIVEARARARLTRVDPEPDPEPESESADEDDTSGVADPVVADPAVALGASQEDSALTQESGPYRLRSWDPEVGLALFDVLSADETAFTLSDPRTLPSGSYLGAVTLDASGRSTVTPGYLVTARSAPEGGELVLSMNLPEALSIAAVVNLDGALVGVAFDSPDGPRVVTSTEMLGLLEALQVETFCRAIEVSDLTEDVRELIELETGVLVEFVDTAAFEPQASLRGGDILLEWGGEDIQSVEQFVGLYDAQEPGSLVSYRVLRGRRRVTGGVVMHAADCLPLRPDPVRLPRFGLAAQWMLGQDADPSAPAGWRIVALASDSPAAASGVQEYDWLVALDGQTLDEEQDRSALEAVAESDDALLLSLLRDGRTKLVAVSPAPEVNETDTLAADVELSRDDSER